MIKKTLPDKKKKFDILDNALTWIMLSWNNEDGVY